MLVLCLTIPAYAQKWDEGGTLRDEMVIGWAMSTDANKLASAADYIKASTEAEILTTLKKGELRQASETAIAAAKYYAKDTGATSVSVVLDSLPGGDSASLSARNCGLRTRRQGYLRQGKLDMEWSASCRNALFRSGT